MSHNEPTNLDLPVISVVPLRTDADASDADAQFVRGQLGITPVTVAGAVRACWDGSDVQPLLLKVKLVVHERSRAEQCTLQQVDDVEQFSLTSTLQRSVRVVWPPEEAGEPGDSEYESEAENVSPVDASPSETILQAMADGAIAGQFSLPVNDHLPGSVALPYGALQYKLAASLVYRLKSTGSQLRTLKWRQTLTVPRWSHITPSVPFPLECAIDEDTCIQAHLSESCLYAGHSGALTMYMQKSDDEAASDQSGGFVEQATNIQLVLYRVDAYRHSHRVEGPDEGNGDDHNDQEQSPQEDSRQAGYSGRFARPDDRAQVSGRLDSVVTSELLRISYIYIVRVDFADRTAEFFFPLEAITPVAGEKPSPIAAGLASLSLMTAALFGKSASVDPSSPPTQGNVPPDVDPADAGQVPCLG
ncbi:hypothetical protein THASP1DRAFT_28409 [Thamnocephalis sphaerospora]|uniref:Uncharacterized protein n=1 Tax=Thamnocephalis sphaerospora TaxID=78915 RepID=A0A4P9XWL4_9FUNG|nr:hypothetical protein THASP1DRAFT_28409 [Thamnocephalis sphaerospora]|eukprot:RKP09790.1 hypothetical protein THASP1DRAFT_28409 [Thamnocephalis sphaerospora]